MLSFERLIGSGAAGESGNACCGFAAPVIVLDDPALLETSTRLKWLNSSTVQAGDYMAYMARR